MKRDLWTGKIERRSLLRNKVSISADVIDPAGCDKCHCHILDATRDGCRIYCDDVHKLPGKVCLHPEGASQPIKATILWRKDVIAGLSFDWAETPLEQSDGHVIETDGEDEAGRGIARTTSEELAPGEVSA